MKGKFNQGKCLVNGCNNFSRASNMCNPHYLKYYFMNEPGGKLERGQRHFRRNSIAYEVSLLTGIPFEQSRRIVRNILDIIAKALKEGKEVSIPGFGYFGVHKFNKYVYGHPVYFWPSRELRSLVNKWSLHENQLGTKD